MATEISCYVLEEDNTEHMVYAFNGKISELYRKESGSWNRSNLTEAAPAPDKKGSPSGYQLGQSQHVVYIAHKQIQELWWSLDERKWHYTCLTIAGGGPSNAIGNVYGYSLKGSDAQNVVYRDDDGNIHEIWYYAGKWSYQNLTVASGGAPKANGDPTGIWETADKTNHVFYRMKSSNHIIELWLSEGKWNNHNLMSDTLAPLAYSGSAGDPSVYECRYDNSNSLHVIYKDRKENIHELWRANGKWSHNDLTKATGTAPKAGGKPYGYVWEKDKSQHVVYQDQYGGIHELWHKEGSWNHNNLTQITNAPPAESDPKGYVLSTSQEKEGQTQHIVYHGKDRYFHELRYENGKWSHYVMAIGPKYVERALPVLEALQNKSYTSGWFSLWQQPWRLPHPWLAYNTLESLIDYTELTRDENYIEVIKDVADSGMLGRIQTFGGNDDVGWAGIALVKAYRLTRDTSYLKSAKDSAFWQLTGYWDDKCKGGVWWDFKKTYKNAITNELFLMLATMLYQETNEPQYLDWAIKAWNWFNDSGLINSEHLINDGLDTQTCKNNKQRCWTYNQGVILGGLTNLWLIQRDPAYIEKANQIAQAVIASNELTSQNILREGGERFGDPNDGGVSYKGIFMRYLAYLAFHEPKEKEQEKQKFIKFIWTNADHVWETARHKSENMDIIHPTWVLHSASTTEYGAVAQSSGLDLFNAAMRLV